MGSNGFHQPRRCDFFTKVVMWVCSQPVVAVNEGHEGDSLGQIGELQLLKYMTIPQHSSSSIRQSFHSVFLLLKPLQQVTEQLFNTSDKNNSSFFPLLQHDKDRGHYQVLAILLVDCDHAALCSAFPAGLFDADVNDIREVTQGLQFLTPPQKQRRTF